MTKPLSDKEIERELKKKENHILRRTKIMTRYMKEMKSQIDIGHYCDIVNKLQSVEIHIYIQQKKRKLAKEAVL